MAWFLSAIKTSGTNTHGKLTADSAKELERAARLLRVEVKDGYRDAEPHLDLKPKKWIAALNNGAIVKEAE